MPTFPSLLRQPSLDCLARFGIRRDWAVAALAKWEARATPEPCQEELRGKPYGVESSGSHPCACRGCQERRCFKFFSTVLSTFPGALP